MDVDPGFLQGTLREIWSLTGVRHGFPSNPGATGIAPRGRFRRFGRHPLNVARFNSSALAHTRSLSSRRSGWRRTRPGNRPEQTMSTGRGLDPLPADQSGAPNSVERGDPMHLSRASPVGRVRVDPNLFETTRLPGEITERSRAECCVRVRLPEDPTRSTRDVDGDPPHLPPAKGRAPGFSLATPADPEIPTRTQRDSPTVSDGEGWGSLWVKGQVDLQNPPRS
jgi:hypothetical protein